jgi:hypothetical protein
MKHLNYTLLTTLPNMIWVRVNGCGLEAEGWDD